MTYIPPANGGRINLTIGGNTAGAGSLVSSGTATLVGGNNITLSQNGNAITISGAAGGGAAGSNTIGISNLGNTSGTSGVISGSALQYALAGGNNVTLSQSINGSSGTVTISAANQSVQTQSNIQGIYDGANSISTGTVRFSNSNGVSFGINGQTITGSHNGITSQTNQTMGMYATGNTTQNSSATFDARSLTFNGLGGVSVGYSNGSVQISGGAGGGGGGGIALANSQTTYTSGTANLAVAGGAMTIGSTTGQSFNFSVPQTSSLSATGGISISTNGSTISIGVNTANSMDFYQNMDRGTSSGLAVPYNSTGGATLMLQRLNQENDEFGANITANTVLLNMSGSLTATSASTGAHTMTAYIGVYADNTTALSLINSASSSWSISANSNNSASYNGPRWLSFVSSQWSSAPNFAQGSEYVFGVFLRATNVAIPMSYIGQNYMMSVQRSGSFGAPTVNSNTLAQGNYWNAIYSVSTSAFPTAISASQVNRNNASAIFMPHIVLNNRYSGTF